MATRTLLATKPVENNPERCRNALYLEQEAQVIISQIAGNIMVCLPLGNFIRFSEIAAKPYSKFWPSLCSQAPIVGLSKKNLHCCLLILSMLEMLFRPILDRNSDSPPWQDLIFIRLQLILNPQVLRARVKAREKFLQKCNESALRDPIRLEVEPVE